eukprot:TRINITY_DN513_c9_g1_i1.p1 TRINITY_DN513_c9_g1~~TRINITY_DN513_c9_g1_i1.p1  ORF type:complete len:329 (+),score=74.78 TRINITY_DN513_c9_g1_i1:41-1027(+)
MANIPPTMIAVVGDGGKCVIKEFDVPLLAEGEVLVKIAATAVNRADTLQRKGLYPVPAGVTAVLGLEMSGTVMTEGKKWKVGDEVMGLLSGGGYGEYCAVDEGLLMPIPKGYTTPEAAAIPETWLTAFQLLHLVGNIKENDVVVIHAAGSGVGTAAIQLASKVKGVTIVATAGTEEKLKVAAGLGASITLNYKEGDWAEELKKAIPTGATLILDPVGGSHAAKNCEAIAVDGTWVLYGLMGGATVPDVPILGKLLQKRINLKATTLRSRTLEYRCDLVNQFMERHFDKFAENFRVVYDCRSFGIKTTQEAHEYMETNANVGKILIKIA